MNRLKNLPPEVVQAYLSFPQRNRFLPVEMDNGLLKVWVLDAKSWPLADYLAWSQGLAVETMLMDKQEFYPMLEQALALWEEESDIGQEKPDTDLDIEETSTDLLGWGHDDAPIVRLVNKSLHQAIGQGASDIHMEAQEDGFLIRLRLDGELHTMRRLNRALQPTVIARIKVMGEMDVAESRKPQDGRIRVRVGNKDVDVRVSTLPTMNGEKAVMRILDRSKNILELTDLGFEGRDLQVFRRALAQPYGIILVTGPTGSGKTTSLYAGLSELVSEEKNIMTVEDPVEYHLDGINQVQVNNAAGVSFASSIRAFLRQDPDIILVGEIRDQETASAAVQASLTGHLVLSTLHTNDAATAVTRLLEMGLEPFLVASSLSLALGQRLVRTNCPHCSREVDIPEATMAMMDKGPGKGNGKGALNFSRQTMGTGCDKCLNTGFKGRRAIVEILPVDEEVRGQVIQKASADKLKEYGHTMGYRTMFEHGVELVRRGVTTMEEVMRVTRM